jgi:hypothetical protein
MSFKRVKKADGTIHTVNEKFLSSVLKDGDEVLKDQSIDKTPPTITAEMVENDLKRIKADEGKKYLAETDWYVHRKGETGKAIPSDVLTKREQARTDADFKV